jgi:hypothetical protein
MKTLEQLLNDPHMHIDETRDRGKQHLTDILRDTDKHSARRLYLW